MKKIHFISNIFIVGVLLLGVILAPAGTANAQKEVPTFVVEPTDVPTEVPTEVPTSIPTAEPLPIDNPIPTDVPELSPTPEVSITPTPELTPTEPIVLAPYYPASAEVAAPGHYIIVFKEGMLSGSALDDTAASLQTEGAQISFVYKHALKGFAASLTDSALEKLRQDPRVAYIVEDEYISVADDGENPFEIQDIQSTPPSWGLDRIDQRALPYDNEYHYVSTAGAGVNVYVLDTGIRMDHQEFGGRATSGYDFIDKDTDASDCQGHGTHVAGTIGGETVGVAKDVNLISVRVLGCDGTGLSSTIIAGVDWVAFNSVKPAVANMSLVGSANDAIDYAVINAIGKGVTFVVASGNYSKQAYYFSPARVAAAITVGAIDVLDQDTWYSNYGVCLDLYAPGTDIYSSTISGTGSYGLMSGTSMAAPHVAGAAALYLAAYPNASPATVASKIVSNSTKDVLSFPFGQADSPNKLLYISPKIPSGPTLLTPVTGFITNNTTPEFSWKSIYNADTYQLQLSTTSYFGSPIETNVDGTSFTLLVPLTDGIYYWRVRGVNAFESVGGWSEVYTLTIDTIAPLPPILLTPVNNTMARGTPSFVWKSSVGAKYYQFGYNDSNSTSDLLYQSDEIKWTSIHPPAMPLLTEYYWFVRARDVAGNWSDWSEPNTITILPQIPVAPSLASPPNGGLTNDPTPELAWYEVPFGASFQVQISTNSLFTAIVQDTDGITDLFLDTDTLADGVYFWRVRAINILDEPGLYSKSRKLTVDTIAPAAPTLKKPANGSEYRGTPNFVWSQPITGYSYQFAYNTTGNTVAFDFTSPVTKNLYFKPPAMPPMATYYWFARASDQAGNWSSWSAPWTIFILPPLPATPVLTAPATKTVTNDPTPDLSWNTATNAVAYQLQIATNLNFSTIVRTGEDLVVRTYTPTSLPTGVYYWRVRREECAWRLRAVLFLPYVHYRSDPTCNSGSTPAIEWSRGHWNTHIHMVCILNRGEIPI